MGCYTIDIHDNVTCDDSGVNRIYFAGGIKSAKSVTSAGFSNTNDQGFGGLTWTAQNGASACVFLSNNATTSGITVSQYAQAFTVSVPAGVAATSSNCFHSASWSNFTGHSISFKYNTGAGGTQALAAFEVGLNVTNKINVYVYDGDVYAVYWYPGICAGNGYEYLTGGSTSCTNPTTIYAPNTYAYFRICDATATACSGVSIGNIYVDYSADGVTWITR